MRLFTTHVPFVTLAKLESVDAMFLVVWIPSDNSNKGEEARRNGFEKIIRVGYVYGEPLPKLLAQMYFV